MIEQSTHQYFPVGAWIVSMQALRHQTDVPAAAKTRIPHTRDP